jgi:hypothetical protein
MLPGSNRIARTVALAALLAAPILPQQFRGTVSGRVLDPQGAAVPGANIAATQLETGAKSQTASGPAGQFNLPFLAPGTYTITIEAAGFKRYIRDNLVVSANEPIALDVALELGQASDTVTISVDAPLLHRDRLHGTGHQ